ncbi:5'-adenylylsulfate reductase-like 4 [Bienertia sinuspersici]
MINQNMRRFWCVFVIAVFSGVICGGAVRVSELGYCPAATITDAILGFPDSICDLHHSYNIAVIEGDEASLQKALHLVYSQNQDYVAVLFYASWCLFSRNFRPSFSTLSSLYPSIPHFAIEESSIRPSILSKYGVHGFPTLFLLNSTMRVRYRGSRSLDSLVAFYGDVTGIKSDPREKLPLEKIEGLSKGASNAYSEPENCPFSWARSPENLLRQETYLALATAFVVLRLLYLLFPCLLEFARSTWSRYVQNVRIRTLWEHPLRSSQGKELPEGAINARAWASKSLASAVAIGGDASTSRGATVCATH